MAIARRRLPSGSRIQIFFWRLLLLLRWCKQSIGLLRRTNSDATRAEPSEPNDGHHGEGRRPPRASCVPLFQFLLLLLPREAAAARAPAMSSTPSLATALESLGDPSTTGELGRGYVVKFVNRNDGSAWGMLRGKTVEDTAEGSREAVAAEYRQGVEAYFRVLAERARKKK